MKCQEANLLMYLHSSASLSHETFKILRKFTNETQRREKNNNNKQKKNRKKNKKQFFRDINLYFTL